MFEFVYILYVNKGEQELKKYENRNEVIGKGSYNVGPYKVCVARIVPKDSAVVEYIYAKDKDVT